MNRFKKIYRKLSNKKSYMLDDLLSTGVISEFELNVLSDSFDEKYYLEKYPDVKKSGYPPLVHFIKYGQIECRNPNSEFDTGFYVNSNPDVVSAGINPFYHYIVAGKKESRAPNTQTQQMSIFNLKNRTTYKAIKDAFDKDYYLAMYPDVLEAGIDPIKHYIEAGAKEFRDPSPHFSTKYYLEDNEDVQNAGLNPFYHYVVAGQFERRFPKNPGGKKAEIIWNLSPLNDMIQHWKKELPEQIEKSDVLFMALTKSKDEAELAVSFSHDNYAGNTGGVQVCIEQEQKKASSKGINYLHLSPYMPLPILCRQNNEDKHFLYNVVFNGDLLGVFDFDAIKDTLTHLQLDIYFFVHALQGHSPKLIVDLIDSLPTAKQLNIWMHDSFVLCPNYTAQRNNVDFCGLPPVSSQSCEICVYGQERISHIDRVGKLLETSVKTQVICPSEYTKNLFESRSPYTQSAVRVVPHIQLTNKSKVENDNSNTKLRLAFVGFPVEHKGWSDFEALYFEFLSHEKIEFIHIASRSSSIKNIEFIETTVDKNNPDAMRNAVAENNVDIVFIPSRTPETFNLVCHEAIAAGALVYCFSDSGNISRTVAKYHQGEVFETLCDIKDKLRSVLEYGIVADRYTYDMQFSNLSFDTFGDK